MSNEYHCDKCGTHVENGSGYYIDDDRVCYDCFVASPFAIMAKNTKYDPNAFRYGNCIAFTPDAIRDEAQSWITRWGTHKPEAYDSVLWALNASDEVLEIVGLRAINNDAVWIAFRDAVLEEIMESYPMRSNL